jgi:hypothetical protein
MMTEEATQPVPETTSKTQLESAMQPVPETTSKPVTKAPSIYPPQAPAKAVPIPATLSDTDRITALEKNHANLLARLRKRIAFL